MNHYSEVTITEGASSPYAVDEVSPQILQSYPDLPRAVQGTTIYIEHTDSQVVRFF